MAKKIMVAAGMGGKEPINVRLLQYLIRRGMLLERYKTNVVRQIIAMFNRNIMPDISQKLFKYLGQGTITASRIKDLAVELKDLQQAYEMMGGDLQKELQQFVLSDAKWQKAMMEKTVPVQLDFILPTAKVLESLATKSYVHGKLIDTWFKDLAVDTRNKVVQQVNIGMVNGESIDQMVRRIIGTKAANYTDGILDTARYHVESVVRSSVATVNNNARTELYQANSDVIKSVQGHATLDPRTCEECASIDGEIYDIEDAPNYPLHWSCRCILVPVLKSWKELGIDLKEAPEGTRAAMDGQIPESMTWPQWLKTQSTEVQNEALGVGKAQIFRQGIVPFDRFVDRKNMPLTLSELEKLEGQLSKAN